jgi:two-component system sensor histidine kinase PilS (NtrC family)
MTDSPQGMETSAQRAATYWRLMRFSNLYRCIIASIFLGLYFFLLDYIGNSQYNSALYFQLALAYLGTSLLTTALTWIKWPRFDYQLTLQASADIVFIVALMYAAGGVQSGFGILLILAIAATSIISEGRLALFYAALATIALLLEQSYQVLVWSERYDDYSHAVLLSLSCFATAWLAHSFGKRAQQSEALASRQSIDLENLSQINELIAQEMPDGILVVDEELKLRHHNTQAERLLGMTVMKDTDTLDAYVPEMAALMRSWMMQSGDIGPGTVKFTTEERALSLRFTPVGSDRKHGAVIFIEDWSQMQAQAQQLKLAALGRLTANIAHEIRNPLSAISHANQLLQEEEQRDPASQRMLQIIADNVQRMDQMVKEILELNRRDRTRQEIIALPPFIEEFHEQFCQAEKVPFQGFALNIGDQAAEILFDRRHLNQILWNLCRNGWRHSKQQAASLSVSLLISANGRAVSLEIHDDGLGLSAEAIQHLFEPFFTTEASGTGLGLYIARELCEANGANIKYMPGGNGSLFIISMKKSIA